MEIKIENIDKFHKSRRRALALGVFDGVHLGHQAVLSKAEWALTFDPHPRALLDPVSLKGHLLTTLEERRELIPNMMVLRFDQQTAHLSAEKFVSQLLVNLLGVKELYIGHDFRFGHGREGDLDIMSQLSSRYGIMVCHIPGVCLHGEEVRSSRIRLYLQAGLLERAEQLLGRPYSMTGIVIEGDKRGRTLQFPTANIQVPIEKLIPANGVYIVRVQLETGDKHWGLGSIGTRPTFYPDQTTIGIEIFIKDFKGNLYGKQVKFDFIKRLRDELTFANPVDLQRQMHADLQALESMLD